MASAQSGSGKDPMAAVKKAEAKRKEEERKARMLRIDDLEKFYLTPYLTCSECNTVNFVDAMQLEAAMRKTYGEAESPRQKRRGWEREKEEGGGVP